MDDGEVRRLRDEVRRLREENTRLRQENERQVMLLDAVDDVLVLDDAEGRLLYVNRAGRDYQFAMTGRTIEQALGKTVHVNLPELAKRFAAAEAEALLKGSAAVEVLLPLPAGARWQEHKFVVIRGRDGERIGLAGTSRDVHERVLAREELAQALAFREQIIGILGHDMRNPLSAISALAKLTLRRSDLPTEVYARLAQVEQAALRTLEMIETLLDFTESRFQKTFTITRTRTNVHVVCRSVVAEIAAAHPQRSILVLESGDAHADCDGARIAQVISNLVSNALHHGAKDGPVEVLVAGHDEHVDIRVSNRGAPIPQELMAVLFEPFRRRPDALDRPRGLGLGLYITQQIVAAHRGRVTVESTTEVTCFTVRLPRRDERGSE